MVIPQVPTLEGGVALVSNYTQVQVQQIKIQKHLLKIDVVLHSKTKVLIIFNVNNQQYNITFKTKYGIIFILTHCSILNSILM